MNKKLLLVFIGVFGLFAFAGKKGVELFDQVELGNASIKSFTVISDSIFYQVNSLSDFLHAMGQIGKSIDLQNIFNIDITNFSFSNIFDVLPNVDFRFDVNLPVINNSSVDIPNLYWDGTATLSNVVIADVSYQPTTIPANQTTVLNTNVTSSITQFPSLVKSLLQNPNSILNGVDLKGNFVSDLLTVPYNTNVKFF